MRNVLSISHFPPRAIVGFLPSRGGGGPCMAVSSRKWTDSRTNLGKVALLFSHLPHSGARSGENGDGRREIHEKGRRPGRESACKALKDQCLAENHD